MLNMNGLICPMISEPGKLFPCQLGKCAWFNQNEHICSMLVVSRELCLMRKLKYERAGKEAEEAEER